MKNEELRFENIYRHMEPIEDKQTKNLLDNSDSSSIDLFCCCNIFNWELIFN